MNKFYQIFVLFSCFIILNSCNKTPQKTNNVNLYRDYILGFPEKQISVVPNLQFFLHKPVDVTTVSDDVVSITPKVEGTVSLQDNVISFIPKSKLEPNQNYNITLHLSKLYNDIDSDLKDFTIISKTKKLFFSVSLEAPSFRTKDYYSIDGMLTASDVIESDNLPKVLTADYRGKQVPITFHTTEGLASKVHFTIDSLQRADTDTPIRFDWNGKSIHSESEGTRELTIVGKRNFKVLDVRVVEGSNQQIEISFSDPISPSQDLQGLIQFVGTQKRSYTYKVNNNVVSVYPASSFKERVTLTIFKGIKSADGHTLKQNLTRSLHFEQPKPSVSFIKSGVILPDADNLKINFTAVSLRAVDVTVYKIYKNNILQFLQQNNLSNKGNLRYVGRPEIKYTVDLSNQGLNLNKENAFAVNLADLITVENGAMYRVELSFNQHYSNYSCNGKTPNETITFGKKQVDTQTYDEVEKAYYGYGYEDYNWSERNDPCTPSYYLHHNGISTNVLATNLGVIVKKGNNQSTFVVVTDILTTQPVSNASVTLYNLQQQPLASQNTNADGIAQFKIDANAYFAVVSKDDNTTYVKLNDGNALSMSKFDVSGVKLQQGIQGFIYGERGVWRPGDFLYLTFVLNDTSNPLPENHPIKFELINPKGKIMDRNIQYKKPENVYGYAPKTAANDITGNWKLRVTVGNARFEKRLKIETIKPNRLKIKMAIADKTIKANTSIKGNLEVKWLHGAIAKGLKAGITGKFYQSTTAFKGYKQYVFDDITRTFSSETFDVFEGTLTDNGTASFSVLPNLNNKAPGMLKASFVTKVYENGGDFSTDVYTQPVSPYTSYVGLNPAEEQQSKNYLFTDKDYTFNVATLNENGAPISNNVLVTIYKLEWRWWWSTSDNGLSEYDGARFHSPYKSFQFSTNADGKGDFKLKINENDWGRYLIKVKDKQSGHVSSKIVYFDWPSWYGKKRGSQDPSNATMLVFSTDKEAYKVNETASVTFPSSKGSRALITIENGTEVLDHFWVDTNDKQTTFRFPVLAHYTPNVFLNISLLQQHSQTVNDLPIRLYGSVPMQVTNPATELHPEIEIADELKPESTTSIEIREKNGTPMTYTVALVDEGLLDLTRFKTPNPWDVFYAQQSLGVKTWDVFDQVIGAYGGNLNQILSIGGDQAEAASKNKKANRFKPIVTYLGPFHLPAGATQQHTVSIPRYVGSLRAMVVASNVSQGAYGSTEKNVFVRKPVMVLASLPRKITPKETVILPVTVFAMKPHIKNVTVGLQPNQAYEIVGETSQTVSFNQPDEKMVYFKLKVTDFKGIGTIKVKAVSGFETASYDVEVDVLNPNPLTTETHDLVLQSGESSTINFKALSTTGTNTATLEFSTLPPMNFTKRLDYLIQYPHGCVEQTTSSAFPQLYFNELFDLATEKKNAVERNIKATIQRLYSFQLANGGLPYWPGNSSADDWGTSYAGHFMIEAGKKGYVLPIGFMDKWKNYQKQVSRNWRYRKDRYSDNAFNQAYRLYTLALANSPDLASMNRLRETNGLTNNTKRRLALAYALIGKQSVAQKILRTLSGEEAENQKWYESSYGSETRNTAMALETAVLLNNQVTAIKLAKQIANELSSDRWMSTQTTAYSLVVIAAYALKNGGNAGINATYTFNAGSRKTTATSKSLYTVDLKDIKQQNVFNISNKANGALYVRAFNKGVLPVGEEKVIQKNLEASVVYKAKDGTAFSVDNLKQGTNFVATIRVKNLTDTAVKNIALTQSIPSGWEVVNTRFTDFGSRVASSKVDYTDIRDASIHYYFSLKPNESKTFNVLLNASYLGTYYLPGVQAQAMYDYDYIVRTQGRWIQVVR